LLGQAVCAKIVVACEEPAETVRVRVRQRCTAELVNYKVPARIIITDGPLVNDRSKKIRRCSEAELGE
jgi:hypothetical protein